MSDPLTPPPRRPMPERLQIRISRDLAAAPTHRPRRRSVAIPLAAAALITAAVVTGVAALGDRDRVGPVETASPYPTTASPTTWVTPSTPTPTPRPSKTASASLVVRPMTKAEIVADTRTCSRNDPKGTDIPREGTPKVQYAMVLRHAGPTGAESPPVRALLLQDGVGYWDCADGQEGGWTRGERSSGPVTGRTPVAEFENSGGTSASCGGGSDRAGTSGLFAVGQAVRTGRVRIIRGDNPGPWLTAEPAQGLVYVLLRLAGPAAAERGVTMEFQFLDRNGRPLPVSYNQDDKPVRSLIREFPGCPDFMKRFPTPKVIKRPASDAVGIKTCQAMAKESAKQSGKSDRDMWQARLVISTAQEWGAVLTSGTTMFGCSLYPTKEISPFFVVTAKITKESFSFALNPIEATGGSSLWATGRAPSDVSAISYRLPGKRDVAARINDDGYWMLMFHTDGADLAEGNVADWPPVVVTITRPSGTQRLTIPFTVETMCRQVTHGC